MSPAAEEAVRALTERDRAQRRAALLKANGTRTYRREVKESLARADVRLVEVLIGPDPRLASARVFDLLMAVPAVGKVKALAWLKGSGLSATSTVRGATVRQRVLLASYADAHEATSAVWKKARRKTTT